MENLYDLIVEGSRGLRRLQRKLGAAVKAHRKAGGGPVTPKLAKVAGEEVAKRREGEARAKKSKKSQEAALKAQAKAEAKAQPSAETAERREKQGLPSTPRVPNVGREENARRRRGRF
jgi:nucleotide-binding universal stress UspA family protein